MTGTLVFENRNATPQRVKVNIDRDSVPLVMSWYAAFHSGDFYRVKWNGNEVIKTRNGEPMVWPIV